MSSEKLKLMVKDLRVGDRLEGYRHSNPNSKLIEVSWVVAEVLPLVGVRLADLKSGRDLGVERFDTSKVTFEVVRGGQEVDIVAGNLLPGDVVVACWDTSKNSWYQYAGRYEVTKVKNDYVFTKSQNGGIGITLFDNVRVLAIRSGAPAAVAAKSPWNGRCGACGRNTYTGFLAVEHEGGACG